MTAKPSLTRIAVFLAAGTVISAQEPIFRSATRMVPLYATVTDGQRRLIGDLGKDEFEIFDNGKPQEIQLFNNEVQPITVAVMLDTSGSMTGNLTFLQNAAEQFLLRLLPKDRARLGYFNDKIRFLTPFTGDRDRLVASLKDWDFGNPTRLYDAIDFSIEQLVDIEGRRVVLVFTDGEDTASAVGAGAVLNRARAREIMIYAIGLQSDYFNGARQVRSKPDSGLRRLAEETGGGYFELEKTAELAPTFTRVAQELHSQYVLGFVPAVLDGKIHQVSVRAKRAGTQVRTRQSYVANR